MPQHFCIGWDVGAWSTKKGDAVWVLDQDSNSLGNPWNGNLRLDIEAADSAEAFARRLLARCEVPLASDDKAWAATLGIDAPFAFSLPFRNLLEGTIAPVPSKAAIENPYLFRATERFAAQKLKRNPLSAIQAQIGSQATKVAHVLAKCGLVNSRNGVWTPPRDASEIDIRVIEVYPAMCKERGKKGQSVCLKAGAVKAAYDAKLTGIAETTTPDEKDALICALIAHAHAFSPTTLNSPCAPYFEPEEGWIWFPKN